MLEIRKPLLFLAFVLLRCTNAQSQSQTAMFTTQAIEKVSVEWRKDSSSCLNLRMKLYESILSSRPDSLSKEKLFGELGKPNRIQKVYRGVSNKYYVEYIYDIYKDECPRVAVEAFGLTFVFDENEMFLIEIVTHDYCG